MGRALNKRDVAEAIGWLDSMDTDKIEFTQADCSKVAKDGTVRLEGEDRKTGDWLYVTVRIEKIEVVS